MSEFLIFVTFAGFGLACRALLQICQRLMETK